MTFYNSTPEAAAKELGSDLSRGLDPQQAQERLAQYGENRLREAKKKHIVQRFLDQFKDVMILILIAAAAVSLGIAVVEKTDFFEPVLILVIVILNAVMGVMQESKAEKALDALKNLSAPHARVIRGGMESVIYASQLVPGDLIHL